MKKSINNNTNNRCNESAQHSGLHESLNNKVLSIIEKIPNKYIGLSEIIILLGKEGMLLFTALLTIIFLIPYRFQVSALYSELLFSLSLLAESLKRNFGYLRL